MIKFEEQARKFLSITGAVQISANAQCLYFQLLNFFNSKGFPNEMQIDNMTIHSKTRLSRQQLTTARHELQKLSLIDYMPGSGSASGKYVLSDIQNAKIDSVMEICKKTDGEIDNLTALNKQVEDLTGDYKLWAKYILKVINDAISKNKHGVYQNYYATTLAFVRAKNTLQFDTLMNITKQLIWKPDIKNRDAYILTCISNEVKNNRIRRSTKTTTEDLVNECVRRNEYISKLKHRLKAEGLPEDEIRYEVSKYEAQISNLMTQNGG